VETTEVTNFQSLLLFVDKYSLKTILHFFSMSGGSDKKSRQSGPIPSMQNIKQNYRTALSLYNKAYNW